MDKTNLSLENYAISTLSVSLFFILVNTNYYWLNLLGCLILALCVLWNFINFIQLFLDNKLISPIEKAVIVTGIYDSIEL